MEIRPWSGSEVTHVIPAHISLTKTNHKVNLKRDRKVQSYHVLKRRELGDRLMISTPPSPNSRDLENFRQEHLTMEITKRSF